MRPPKSVTQNRRSSGWDGVLPTLTECDRYDLNQPSASLLIL